MASWILSALMCAVVGVEADCTIVHFTADGCEPCKQIAPALAQLQQEGWAVQTVDVHQQPDVVRQYRVENLPTLVIVCRQQEVDRIVGAATYERMQQRIQRAAARNLNGPARSPTASSAGAVVRGQSPSMGAFPLLASAGQRNPFSHAASQAETASPPTTAVAPVAILPDLASNHSPQFSTPAPQVALQPAALQPAAPQPVAITVEQAIARAAAATVRIRVDEANTTAYGTGTIVDVRGQEALILTCGHLFRDMQPHSQLTIDLFPGTAQEVNLPSELIDFKAEGEDIGLISCRLPVPVEPVPLLTRGTPLSVGQPAFSFGCDRGANPTRRDTQIKSINRYLGADNIEIVGAPVLGRSGGGLFDIQGRLIGVCNAANPEDDEGIYAAADVVYNQIQRLGLSELFESAAPTPVASSPEQLASQSLQWPDQSATVPTLNSSHLASASTSAPAGSPAAASDVAGPVSMSASNTRQLICIVRDAGGQDKVVTIDAPPEQLLQMIQQSSLR